MASGLFRLTIKDKKREQVDPVNRKLVNRLRDAGVIWHMDVEQNELNFVVYCPELEQLPFQYHFGKPLCLVRQKK